MVKSNLKILVIIGLSGFLLAGCKTAEQAQREAAQNKAAALKQDKVTCQEYGFAPGTESFAACMQTEAKQRQQKAAMDAQTEQMQWANQQQNNAAMRRASCNAGIQTLCW